MGSNVYTRRSALAASCSIAALVLSALPPFANELIERCDHLGSGHEASLRGVFEARHCLLMGDLHQNKEVFHRQVSIIERFATTRGQAAVCIEYLPYSSQESLDLYISGEIDQRTFIATSQLENFWGPNFQKPLDLINFCRVNGFRCFGLNCSKQIIDRTRKSRLNSLVGSEADHIGYVLPPDEDYIRYIIAELSRTVHRTSDKVLLREYVRAQLMWDTSFATNIENSIQIFGFDIVAIVGASHLSYGYGVQRQMNHETRSSTTTILPREYSRCLTSVGRRIADFIY